MQTAILISKTFYIRQPYDFHAHPLPCPSMAGPLRKVSRNHLWTIKRAHNDLHYSISSPLSASLSESSSTTTTKPIELSTTSPWDPDRLQWKFKSEYEELCEHFEHSFIILVSWLLTIDQLFRIGLRYFIRHPAHSVTILYDRRSEIAISRALLTSIWHRSVPAFRHVAFFMLSWLRDVFHSSVYVNFDAVPLKDEIQVEPPTPIELQDPYAKVPGSPTVFGSEHASPEDKFSASTSDSYHTWIDPSLVDPPKGRIPAATHNVESVVYRRPGHIEMI
ncbi:hypothetical protein BGW80DRAFT_1316902 [Lactifluus volemus]|nr:hypothetical protein BGW80DRAFT_1316902 [Lactifluus volemus]